jgi:threonine synthase
VALGAPQPGHQPSAVPSGNFGDAFAGYVAKRMGLPIAQDHRCGHQRQRHPGPRLRGRPLRARPVKPTQSPRPWTSSRPPTSSGSISKPSAAIGVETARAFQAFADTGHIDIPPGALAAMRETFRGVSIGEDETRRTIVVTLNETGELIDPHTAVGVAALRHVARARSMPIVVLSTAHPAKFPDDVAAASGVTPDHAAHRRQPGRQVRTVRAAAGRRRH